MRQRCCLCVPNGCSFSFMAFRPSWSDDMLTLNRSAIRVIAKQPLLDWLQFTDPGEPPTTLDEVNDEPSIYLIPECEDDQEFAEQLNEVFPAIFEAELEGWDVDPEEWPDKRGFDVFLRMVRLPVSTPCWWTCRKTRLTTRSSRPVLSTATNPVSEGPPPSASEPARHIGSGSPRGARPPRGSAPNDRAPSQSTRPNRNFPLCAEQALVIPQSRGRG